VLHNGGEASVYSVEAESCLKDGGDVVLVEKALVSSSGGLGRTKHQGKLEVFICLEKFIV
jgi:hypothetical protein